MTESERRAALKTFAALQLRHGGSRACALSYIVEEAARLVAGASSPAETMIDDLEAVLIGADMTSGRGRGPHFAGNFRGASGFRSDLKDPYNQVQHAMAGIVIGFRYGWAGQQFAMFMEEEEQDDRLYEATCPLGQKLSDSNYSDLGARVRAAIGDPTMSCLGPLRFGPGDFPRSTSGTKFA